MRPTNTKTVRETALLLKTSERRVFQLIESKQLEAINTSSGKVRPRWAIPISAIKQFGKSNATNKETAAIAGQQSNGCTTTGSVNKDASRNEGSRPAGRGSRQSKKQD